MGDRPMAAHLEAIDKTKMSKVCKINYAYVFGTEFKFDKTSKLNSTN